MHNMEHSLLQNLKSKINDIKINMTLIERVNKI